MFVSDECPCSTCVATAELVVIAFTGKAGAGKSTAAAHLITKHGFERVKFASALKEMLRTFLRYRGAEHGAIERMLEGDSKEIPSAYLNGVSPRRALQTLGTEWGRQLIHENLWVDTERDHLPKWGRFVCDDCRFPNEAAMIRGVGGKLIHVVRSEGVVVNGIQGHESEAHTLDADYVLVNTGTIADLCANLDRFVGNL